MKWTSFYRQAFSSRYCRCNADEVSRFESTDTVFLVAFAVIMLNTDLHNANIKPERKMKLNDFIRNLRGQLSSYIFFAVCSIKWLVSSIFRWRPLLPYGTAIEHTVPDRVKPSFVNFRHPGTLTLNPERQSARMSKTTNDSLTQSRTGYSIAVPTWQ